MPTTATQAVLDTPAAEFRLPATDGKTYALDDVAGEKVTVVVFISWGATEMARSVGHSQMSSISSLMADSSSSRVFAGFFKCPSLV